MKPSINLNIEDKVHELENLEYDELIAIARSAYDDSYEFGLAVAAEIVRRMFKGS